MRFAFLAVVLFAQAAAPPSTDQIQQWFEAGNDEQVVQASTLATDPKALYLIGLSFERLERSGDARQVYEKLAARDETDPWALIGRAATNLVMPSGGGITAEALSEADTAVQQAVLAGPSLALAQYQRGIVEAHKGNHVAAAEAFEEATTLDPLFAYAHYYGGLSYSRLDRADQMAIHFERFLRLAPDAPEAGRVESLMRSVRGR